MGLQVPRVTMKAMTARARRALVAAAAAAVLVSCGSDGTGAGTAAADDVARLERRVGDLTAELRELKAGSDRAARQAAARTDRLWEAVARLRRGLAGMAQDLEGATTASDAAAAEVAAAVRELSVLTERYDYHLRRYHGGG